MESERWRVLEAGPGGGGGTGAEGGEAGARTTEPGAGRSTLPGLLATALAVGLGAIAVAIVVLGPTPAVTIDPGGPVEVDPVAAATRAEGGGSAGDTPSATVDEVVVDVGGAVLRPGLLRLPLGSRVGDAIEAAGGYAARVDVARAERELNLAARLADGDRVRVPSRDDPPDVGASGGGSGGSGGSGGATGASGDPAGAGASGGGLVDLNSASEAALEALPGIGPVTAAKIVAGRTERRYASVDELVERGIVGAGTLAKFRDLVTVR